MKRIRLFSAVIAGILLLSSLLSCTSSEIPSGMKEASDTSLVDYHLYVPDAWTVDLQTGAVSAYYSKDDPSSVNVMAWEVSTTDYTPENWWDESQPDLSSVYSDFTLSASSETTLGGVTAKQYVWSGSIGTNTYKCLQVAAVRNSRVYVFTYCTLESTKNDDGSTLESGRFDEHLSDVQNMLLYFSFT